MSPVCDVIIKLIIQLYIKLHIVSLTVLTGWSTFDWISFLSCTGADKHWKYNTNFLLEGQSSPIQILILVWASMKFITVSFWNDLVWLRQTDCSEAVTLCTKCRVQMATHLQRLSPRPAQSVWCWYVGWGVAPLREQPRCKRWRCRPLTPTHKHKLEANWIQNTNLQLDSFLPVKPGVSAASFLAKTSASILESSLRGLKCTWKTAALPLISGRPLKKIQAKLVTRRK